MSDDSAGGQTDEQRRALEAQQAANRAAMAQQLPQAPAPAPGGFVGAQQSAPAQSSGGGGPNWGEGAKGAIGGAGTGAAIGSVIPGVGTAIGAGVGGLIGGLGGLFGGGGGGPPKDSALKGELAAGQGTRAHLAGQLDQFETRGAPQVDPGSFKPGPATTMAVPQINAASHAAAGVARAGQIGPTALGTAGTAGPVAQVGSTTVGSATPMNMANVRGPVHAGAAQVDGTRESGARSGQERLANSLEMAANGQGGPSAAEQMLNQSLGKQIAGQHAIAAGARGASAGRALRTAQINAGTAQSEAAGQLAVLRAKEQMDARGQLAGALQGQRSQDIDVAGQNAQFGQQAGLANAAAGNQINLAAMSNEQDANKFNAGSEAERLKLQATLDQQKGIVNAGATNDAAQAQAGRDTTVSMGNAGAVNQGKIAQAGLDTGVSTTNAGNTTAVSTRNADSDDKRAQFIAGLEAQVGSKNMDAVNQFALESSKIGLEASLANMEATLKSRGMDDAYIANLRNDLIQMHGQTASSAAALAGQKSGPTFGDRLLDTGLQVGMAKATGKI